MSRSLLAPAMGNEGGQRRVERQRESSTAAPTQEAEDEEGRAGQCFTSTSGKDPGLLGSAPPAQASAATFWGPFSYNTYGLGWHSLYYLE